MKFKIRKINNLIFIVLVFVFTILTFVPLVLIMKHIFTMGIRSFTWDFIFNSARPIGELGGGMAHATIGSVIVISLAALASIPIGIILGTYLAEFPASKLINPLRASIDILAGTPSIVIGIFAYVLLVVPWNSFSAIAGSAALSLIIIPIITRSTEEILKLMPVSIREAGIALGLNKMQVIWNILIKCNRQALLTGIILGISRATGETAPLLFTAFGNNYLSYKLTAPIATLPVQIFNYASSPYEEWQQQAWSGAIMLILMVFMLNLFSRFLASR